MELQNVLAISVTIIISVGSAGGIIYAISKFICERFAKLIDAKYEQRLDKQLEKYKLSLEQRRHVTKAQFDKEFEVYHLLSKHFFKMITALSSYTDGSLEVEELSDEDKDIKIEAMLNLIEKAAGAQNILYENMAFIPENIFNKYDSIYEKSSELFWKLEGRTREYVFNKLLRGEIVTQVEVEQIEEIKDEFLMLNKELREYLYTLYIVE